MLNEILEWAAGLGVSVVCCAVEAGAVTYWRSAVDGLAEQEGRLLQACFACCFVDASGDPAAACVYLCALRLGGACLLEHAKKKLKHA